MLEPTQSGRGQAKGRVSRKSAYTITPYLTFGDLVVTHGTDSEVAIGCVVFSLGKTASGGRVGMVRD